MTLTAGFAPIADPRARLLILGSLPGKKSLAEVQYYAHPRNVFWPIIRQLYGIDGSYDNRCRGLIENRIALWDVLRESERPGSLDSSIRSTTAVANDFAALFQLCPDISMVAFNGQKAAQLFRRLVQLPRSTRHAYVTLPSTSPAYASMPVSTKLSLWRDGLQIKQPTRSTL